MKNFFLIRLLEVGRFQIFEVGRSTLLWSTPSVSVYKDLEQRKQFFCLFALTLVSNFPPSLAFEPTSLRFWCPVKARKDIQPHELNNYWFLGSSFNSQPLLN